MPGHLLRQALENSVSQYPNLNGRFASIAGFKFTWDSSKPQYQRIIDVTMADGSPLDDKKKYVMCSFSYLAAGGDGYTCLLSDEVEWITKDLSQSEGRINLIERIF